VLLGALAFSPTGMAQISADRLFPPAVAVGSTEKVKAEGKFAHWPVQCDCDRRSLTIEPGEEQGELVISVPADEAPGLAWIRLYDESSASSLLPLMIEPKVVGEQEPNDKLDAPQTISPPTTVCGRLEKNEDVDGYALGLQSGQQLVVSLVAHELLGSPMDAVLQLVDLHGNVLAQSDDERGLDPQLVYLSPVDQELLVRVFAFPETPNSTIGFAGGAPYVYALRATAGPFLDHSLPLLHSGETSVPKDTRFAVQGWNLPEESSVAVREASDISPATLYLPHALGWQWLTDGELEGFSSFAASSTADEIHIDKLPAVFSGHIRHPTDVGRFKLSVEKDRTYRAEVHSREFGFPLDSVLRVIDADTNQELAKADDLARSNYDAAVEFKAKNSGDVELQISDLADSASVRHAYAIYVYEVSPRVSLTLSADHFALKSGGDIEIEVSVLRRHGFDKKLRVAAVDLPVGVSCEPVVSEPSGNSSKSVKLKLVAGGDAPAFQGNIRFQAQVVDEAGSVEAEPLVLGTYELRPQVHLKQFWLSVGVAADKQG
jgi:hypothetical protein